MCSRWGGEWYRFGGRSALNSLLMASISSGRKEPISVKMDVGKESETGGERRGKIVFWRVGKGQSIGKKM